MNLSNVIKTTVVRNEHGLISTYDTKGLIPFAEILEELNAETMHGISGTKHSLEVHHNGATIKSYDKENNVFCTTMVIHIEDKPIHLP